MAPRSARRLGRALSTRVIPWRAVHALTSARSRFLTPHFRIVLLKSTVVCDALTGHGRGAQVHHGGPSELLPTSEALQVGQQSGPGECHEVAESRAHAPGRLAIRENGPGVRFRSRGQAPPRARRSLRPSNLGQEAAQGGHLLKPEEEAHSNSSGREAQHAHSRSLLLQTPQDRRQKGGC